MTETTQTTQTESNSPETTPAESPVESNIEATVMAPTETAEEQAPEPSLFDETAASMEEAKPEWLPEKFKTGEDLAKSYTELERKLGAHTGAPEAYEMQPEEGLEDYAVNSDDPFATDFARVLKENGVNQKTYDEISNLYFAKVKAEEESIFDAQEHQFREDCKELGEDRVEEIKESIKWSKGILDEESFELIKAIGDKDISVGLLIKQFHDAYTNKNYIKLPEQDVAVMTDKSAIRERYNQVLMDPRIGSDPHLKQEADELCKKLHF